MSIRPVRMVVTFDDPAEIGRITSLFCWYRSSLERSEENRWPFNVTPPVINMFGIDYKVTRIEHEGETIGYERTTLTCLNGGRVIQQLLTVTLERA